MHHHESLCNTCNQLCNVPELVRLSGAILVWRSGYIGRFVRFLCLIFFLIVFYFLVFFSIYTHFILLILHRLLVIAVRVRIIVLVRCEIAGLIRMKPASKCHLHISLGGIVRSHSSPSLRRSRIPLKHPLNTYTYHSHITYITYLFYVIMNPNT